MGDIDVNGILNVSAVDKSTNKGNKITITNDQGSLSKEDIERMVNDAEKFKADDEKQKERIAAKNGLESYCFNMKSTMDDEILKAKISGGEENDKQQVRRGLEVAGEQPAGRGGRVPGQAEGVGGLLQPHHLQTLPARWSTRRHHAQRNAQRNAQRRYAQRYAQRNAQRNAYWDAERISQRWIKLWSNNRRSRLDPCYYISAICQEILSRP